jgi:thioredoxin-related protein
MKSFFIIILAAFAINQSVYSQEKPAIYDAAANAEVQLDKAIEQASAHGKHVFVQIGGNWCPWCVRFHGFVHNDSGLDSLVKANYEVVLINYSKENKNPAAMARLGYPQRFGFPVFVILDSSGKVLHTQDSGYLEEEKSYNRDKVWRMFQMWSAVTLKQAAEKN